jgi:hypothetical protein
VGITLKRDELAVAPRHRLFEGGFDHGAVRIIRDQGGVGALPGRGGVLHDALDVGFRQETQEIDAGGRDVGIGRKRDDRDVARPRHLPDDADRLRKQRPEDDLSALVERLLGGQPRRLGGAAIVHHQKLDVGSVELGDRHLGGVAHRLPGEAGIATGRQRQNETDLDLAGADGGAGRRLGALRRRRRRGERIEQAGIAGAARQERARRSQQALQGAAPRRQHDRRMARYLRRHGGSPSAA